MAKITIDITRNFTGTTDGITSEVLGTKITVTEISPKDQSGPQDVLAYIVAHRLPALLKLAGEQLAEDMTKHGAPAFCQTAS